MRVTVHRDEDGRAKPRCRSEEHTSELQSLTNLVCRLLLEKTIICARWENGEDTSSFLSRERANPVSPLVVSAQLSLFFFLMNRGHPSSPFFPTRRLSR